MNGLCVEPRLAARSAGVCRRSSRSGRRAPPQVPALSWPATDVVRCRIDSRQWPASSTATNRVQELGNGVVPGNASLTHEGGSPCVECQGLRVAFSGDSTVRHPRTRFSLAAQPLECRNVDDIAHAEPGPEFGELRQASTRRRDDEVAVHQRVGRTGIQRHGRGRRYNQHPGHIVCAE